MNPTKSTTRTRLLVLLVAAVALLGIAPGAASAKTVHSDVGLWMQYQPPGNGVAKGFLFGGVSADKKACLNTTVLFSREQNFDPNTWDYVWNYREVNTTDPTFAVYLEDADRGHQYTINTDKQVIRKGNKKIVCDYGAMYEVVNAN
jgi:hypothetical protein